MNNLEKSGLTSLIISEIKKENDLGLGLMSNDTDNQRLINIFDNVRKDTKLLLLKLIDDEDTLCNLLGVDNFQKIRDAEKGMY